MKSLLIIAIICFTVTAQVNAYAADNTFTETRKLMGLKLNQTVNTLREYFSEVKDKADDNEAKAVDLDNRITPLVDKSQDPESNYTVLEQGKAEMDICENNEELLWDGAKWKCNKPEYKSDCEAAPGEYKVANNSGGFLCKQKVDYSVLNAGWGNCNGTQRATIRKCMTTNKTTGLSYETNKSECNRNGVNYNNTRAYFKECRHWSTSTGCIQACGPYGANSSCKCEEGYSYKYTNGRGYCEPNLAFSVGQSDMTLRYSNGDLYWGTFRDNYWGGRCREYKRYMYFDYNPAAVSGMFLRQAWFDDYMWIYVNGRKVYAGPDNQADFSWAGRVTTSYSCKRGGDHETCYRTKYVIVMKNGKPYPRSCERSTSWNISRNINITPYLRKGRNKIEMRTVVYGGGEGAVRFKIYFKDARKTPPICER